MLVLELTSHQITYAPLPLLKWKIKGNDITRKLRARQLQYSDYFILIR